MSFILNGGYYEWEITNNGTTWGAANICEGTLSDGYFDKLSVGNVVARQLKLTLECCARPRISACTDA